MIYSFGKRSHLRTSSVRGSQSMIKSRSTSGRYLRTSGQVGIWYDATFKVIDDSAHERLIAANGNGMCRTGAERDDEEEEEEGGDNEEFVQHGCLRVRSSKLNKMRKEGQKEDSSRVIKPC